MIKPPAPIRGMPQFADTRRGCIMQSIGATRQPRGAGFLQLSHEGVYCVCDPVCDHVRAVVVEEEGEGADDGGRLAKAEEGAAGEVALQRVPEHGHLWHAGCV